MLGTKDRWQEDLFVAATLSSLIPEDHILKQVDKVLDLSWLAKEVSELYSDNQGRPSISPEAALRLMLAGFFQGIVHDRKLMREAQVNIAIRWFAGYRLHEKLPDHSSLTKIRNRWGEERFKKIFQHTVRQCIQADLVSGDTVHFDATLIRADVSWGNIVEKYADKIIEENKEEEPPDDEPTGEKKKKRGRKKTKPPQKKKVSKTDPDASMATSQSNYHLEPTYKQHTAVDDKEGIIVDVKTTTGEANEGEELLNQVDRIEPATGKKIENASGDCSYAHGKNYESLEKRKTHAVIPPQNERRKYKRIPSTRFKYDKKNNIVKCPKKKKLYPSYKTKDQGVVYRAKSKDCNNCPLKKRCVSQSASSRTITIKQGYEAALRAKRRHRRKEEKDREIYKRHRWQVEGIHGEAKSQHGLRRAARRGLWNVSIQVYLTAAVINLKRLAKAYICLIFVRNRQNKPYMSIIFNFREDYFDIFYSQRIFENEHSKAA